MLQAEAAASKDSNPNWWKAMHGQFAEEYWKMTYIKIETPEQIDTWEEGGQAKGMVVLPSTWAFKSKKVSGWTYEKVQCSLLCKRCQIEGVDHVKTFPPVIE